MIDQPLKLPCGHTLANRLCKAAMTEGLADAHDHATPAHQRLYATWARGGAALLLSGNIMVDRRYLERAGNVALEDGADLASLRAWAQVVRDGGSQLWAQISHPGRQCPRLVNATPLAPSVVQLELAGNFGRPRAATVPLLASSFWLANSCTLSNMPSRSSCGSSGATTAPCGAPRSSTTTAA